MNGIGKETTYFISAAGSMPANWDLLQWEQGQEQFSRAHHKLPNTYFRGPLEKEEQGETPPFPSTGGHWAFALFLVTREGGKLQWKLRYN